jgi:nitrite reductase/ring-hydroxylating ferredoxin subunit
VKAGRSVAAFLNRCPHAGAPLDFGDGEFFTEDGRYLQCRTHGALFDPRNGSCVAGPCAGESLERFPAERAPGGGVIVRLTPGSDKT